MGDTTARALARNIAARVHTCSPEDLLILDELLVGLERRRELPPDTRDPSLTTWAINALAHVVAEHELAVTAIELRVEDLEDAQDR